MKVVLIGFMGVGKSTVANQLCSRLQIPLYDTDALALARTEYESISSIFNNRGEIYFRELEIDTSRSLSSLDEGIIATGGGIIMNKINIDYLKQNGGIVVYLAGSFETILERIPDHSTRPAFKDIPSARSLYNLREPLYQAYADATVVTDDRDVADIVDEIIYISQNPQPL